jgi:hypothetical protein
MSKVRDGWEVIDARVSFEVLPFKLSLLLVQIDADLSMT